MLRPTMKQVGAFVASLALTAAMMAIVPLVASAADINLSVPLGGTQSVTGLPDYIARAYRYGISILVVLATIMVVYGGFLYLISPAAGTMKRGKEIILDALGGMVIVLSAYLILQTVNPALTALKMPTLTQIRKVEFKYEAEKDTFKLETERGHGSCYKDSECTSENGSICLRYGIGTAQGAFEVNLNSYVNTDASLYRPPAVFDATTDAQLLKGYCSDGGLGARCRCSGTGCLLMSSALQLDTVDRGIENFRTYGWFSPVYPVRQAYAAYEVLFGPSGNTVKTAMSARAAETNNGGTGVRDCQSPNICMFYIPPEECVGRGCHTSQNITQRETGWFCQRPPEGSGVTRERALNAHSVEFGNGRNRCLTDADCGDATKICMRMDSQQEQMGECVLKDGGALGQRCRCRGWGCGGSPGTSKRVIPCAEGLQCQVVARGSRDGTTTDWLCADFLQETGGDAQGSGDSLSDATTLECLNICRTSCPSNARCEPTCRSGFATQRPCD